MSPLRAAEVRAALRRIDLRDAEDAANRALRCNSTDAVRKLLLEFDSTDSIETQTGQVVVP